MTDDRELLARALLGSDRAPLVRAWCPKAWHIRDKSVNWVFIRHQATGDGHWVPDNPGVVPDFEERGWQVADPKAEASPHRGRPRQPWHSLGRVYDMPDGATVLCVPGFTILSRDFFEGRPDGPPVVFPTFAYPLSESDKLVLARCHHGTYSISPVRLRDHVARARQQGQTQDTIGSWTGPPGWPDVLD